MAWNTRRTYQAAAPCSEPVPIGTLPAGYSITLPNLTLDQAFTPVPATLQPLLGAMTLGGAAALGTPARNPQVGAFIRDSGLMAGTLGELGQVHYVQDFRPDGHIGRPGGFTIGQSAVGYRHATHKAVTLSPTPGGPETEAP